MSFRVKRSDQDREVRKDVDAFMLTNTGWVEMTDFRNILTVLNKR